MNNTRYASLALAAALMTASLAAPALANDFFPPSPVPSSRDNIKPNRTTTKKTQADTNNFILNKKIVKTTKPVDGNSTTPTGKTPGAL